MKETKKRRYIVSTIMYGMILIFIQLPWVVLKGKNYSIYAAYFRIKEKGIKALSEMAASVWDGNLTIIRIQLILLIVFQIVIVLHTVTQWLHKEYYLNIAALVVLGVYIVVNESGFGMLADNSTKTILISAIIMIFVMAEVLIRKMLDVWKDAKESAEIFAEKEREEKEEERRRLYFPGNYTKLFYQMVWHNFKYDWKDYGLLLFCGVIVSAFSFAGLGIYQMMAKAHRAENFLLGEGLGRILLNAMLPMAVCAIFLMVFVLVFYMKKWTQNYSVFVTLGIRKKALYTIIGIEIVVAFLCSLIAGRSIGKYDHVSVPESDFLNAGKRNCSVKGDVAYLCERYVGGVGGVYNCIDGDQGYRIGFQSGQGIDQKHCKRTYAAEEDKVIHNSRNHNLYDRYIRIPAVEKS